MPRNMIKPLWDSRGGRTTNMGDKHYFAHDDRSNRVEGSRPRVSFKFRPTRDRPHNLDFALKHHLNEDITMAVNTNNNGRQVLVRGRGRTLPRGRNSPLPRGGARPHFGSRDRTAPYSDGWYKIIIPYGQKYDKEFILTNLMSYMAPNTFVPVMYKVFKTEAIFYVEDYETAKKLLDCDRKITTRDGFKLQVRIRQGYPQCEVDDMLKERLKLVLSKRYVQETNAMDLSKFYQDPDLVVDYFCALQRPIMLMTVLDIVQENIPNLEALNLDNNRMHIIERLNILCRKFPNLKILYIGDNKIKDINQIDVIKDLKLEELRLEGNPVCAKYKTRQNDYISDVRKRFPRLLKLDGLVLPRPIVFDVVEGSKIPPIQKMFTVNPSAQEVAVQFLQQYFLIYDSDNRKPLWDAYNDQTCFSLSISFNSNAQRLSSYLLENRNLYRVTDVARRRKLLRQGRLSVISLLTELPRTKHDGNSFTMDICLATEAMMQIVVTGVFKEPDDKTESVRYFNRTFIIVPEGSGYCILNEQLHITHATRDQSVQAFAEPSPGSSTSSPATATDATSPASLPEETKQQMTLTLSQQTSMNLEWSLKCLQEVHWNFDNALAVFQEFHKLGQIPAEAFVK